MTKPTVHIQMCETSFYIPNERKIVRDGVSIQLEIDGDRFEKVITLPVDREELRRFGFAPLTRD